MAIPVSVVAFPGLADRASLAAAVDRHPDSVQTATIRASYAARLLSGTTPSNSSPGSTSWR
jgi:hypothetical protein